MSHKRRSITSAPSEGSSARSSERAFFLPGLAWYSKCNIHFPHHTVPRTWPGWHRSYGGPGRGFSEDPTIRVYKRNVIIKQHRGLDI